VRGLELEQENSATGFAFFLGDDLMGRRWERHWAKCAPCGGGFGILGQWGTEEVLDLLVKEREW